MSALLDRATDAAGSQFSHHLVFAINDVSRAAFQAQGHGVIDLESMLGTRVDAHPGSFDGVGDKLHCACVCSRAPDPSEESQPLPQSQQLFDDCFLVCACV